MFPVGVLEDVLVKVDELIFPANFYILEMKGESFVSKAPIILGRPFLKTAGMKIDVKADILSMEFGDDVVHFNLDDAMKPPQEEKFVCHVDVIEEVIDNSFAALYSEFPDLLHSDHALTSYSCSCTDSASCSACLEISQILSIGDVDVASEPHRAVVLGDSLVACTNRDHEIDDADCAEKNYPASSFSSVEQLQDFPTSILFDSSSSHLCVEFSDFTHFLDLSRHACVDFESCYICSDISRILYHDRFDLLMIFLLMMIMQNMYKFFLHQII